MPRRLRLRHCATLSLMMFLSAFTVARCRAQGDPPTPAEAAALARLRAIAVAEETYKFGNLGGNLKYATLAELKRAGLVDWPTDFGFAKDGYDYRDILATPDIPYWGVSAQPIDGGPGRTFVVTMDHRIRGKAGQYLATPTTLSLAQSEADWPTLEALGDIDGNGSTDVSDTVAALRAAAGIAPLTEEQTLRGDLSQDSQVDVQDAIMILRMAISAPLRIGSERRASARLRAIQRAQWSFYGSNLLGFGKFGTLAQLRDAGLVVWPDNSEFVEDGYRYGDVAAPDAFDWGVYAVPLSGAAGRTLVVTMTGNIRGNYGGVPPSGLPIPYGSSEWPIVELY